MADDVLPPAEFRVLLSLMDGPKHGHGVRVDVRERTDGRVDMGPGTLYGAIKRLVGRDWIREVDPPDGEDGDGRRRFYRITAGGREAVALETARMRELLAIANAKRVSAS